MADRVELASLAERCEAATGPDRELDAEIAEHAYGWKPHRIPADYDGENACDVLTPDGGPFMCDGRPWVYPPKGKVHRAYHCAQYTRDATDSAIPRNYVRMQTAAALRALAALRSQTVEDGRG